jgi:hypothetical protein
MKSAGNGAFLVSGASPYAPAMHLDHARRAASSVPICLSIAIIARSARAGAARLLVPAPRAQRNDQRRVIAARLNSLRDNLPRAPHIAHGDKDPIGSVVRSQLGDPESLGHGGQNLLRAVAVLIDVERERSPGHCERTVDIEALRMS